MKKLKNQVSILAIGTELSDGEVVNTNATWLAAELNFLGFKVVLHEVVPDDEGLIKEVLSHCQKHSHRCFVIGGLGPTSDDKTRDVISDWSEKKLVWDEQSWIKICGHFENLGRIPAESNKKQCFFPENSKIISNSNGTANAFKINVKDFLITCLPGPPVELKGIWKEFLFDRLKDIVLKDSKKHLYTWRCMGVSESKVSQIIEDILLGSQFEYGFRARPLMVDIKLWVPDARLIESKIWIEKIESSIKEWLIFKGDKNLAKEFLDKVSTINKSLDIQDMLSSGALTQKLSNELIDSNYKNIRKRMSIVSQWIKPINSQEWVTDMLALSDPGSSTFIAAIDDREINWTIGFSLGNEVKIKTEKFPFWGKKISKDSFPVIAELILLGWLKLLEGDA